MTDLRTAAQQALEALEDIADEVFSPYDNKLGDAILALRAALAEPVQDGKCKYCVDGCPACDARKLPVQEPVTWGVDWGRDGDQSCVSIIKKHADGTAEVVAVEYSPPQRKPLTEEEIDSIWDEHVVPVFGKNGINPIVFARAIERAHNIKE